jgi:hypothetical protein
MTFLARGSSFPPLHKRQEKGNKKHQKDPEKKMWIFTICTHRISTPSISKAIPNEEDSFDSLEFSFKFEKKRRFQREICDFNSFCLARCILIPRQVRRQIRGASHYWGCPIEKFSSCQRIKANRIIHQMLSYWNRIVK